MKEKKIFQPLSSNDVCKIYELLREDKFVSFPITNDAKNKVDGIVSNILGSNYGLERYRTAEEKAMAYLYFLVKDHPFTDGNKRTATLTFMTLCRLNNLTPEFSEDAPLDSLAIFIEKMIVRDHHTFIGDLVYIVFNKDVDLD